MTNANTVASPRDAEGEPVIVAEEVSKVYRGRREGDSILAVDRASFVVMREDTLGLVGESGSGKSTIARMILGLERPTAGRLTVLGVDVTKPTPTTLRGLRRRVQIVFQDPVSSLNPRKRVDDILAAPLRAYHIASTGKGDDNVQRLLGMVGLPTHYVRKYPSEMSGGECQRVAIARALALKPEVIVLDEAVTSLDLSMRSQVLNLLRELQRELRLAYLFISHDLAVVRYMATAVCVMQHGKIVDVGDRAEIFTESRHPYTQALVDAVLEPPSVLRSAQAVGGYG